MDRERDGEGLSRLRRHRHQTPHRMCLLPIVPPGGLDRPVRPPVAHGRERAVGRVLGDRPPLEHDRRQSPDPVQAARRHRAARRPDKSTQRDEVSVAVETHVDSFGNRPQLREGRIEVEIDADRDGIDEVALAEKPRRVDQHVGALASSANHVSAERVRRPGAAHDERSASGQLEGGGRCLEGFDHGARQPVDRLDEQHVMPESPEPEDVLENRPGRPTLVGIAGDHPADHDAQRPHAMSPRRERRMPDESKCSVASARAAALCAS